MAQIKNDNRLTRAPKPVDDRTGFWLNGMWRNFDSVAAALADPDVINYRYPSMTIPINDGVNPTVEYWFDGGVTDSDFKIKTPDLSGLVPYTGATGDVTLGNHNITAGSFIKTGGSSDQFLKADGSVDGTSYAPQSALSGYQLLTQKNQANGYAGLDSGAKILISQLPDSILGALIYQGTWNATTNTPTLADPPASSTKGYYYVTNTAGTQFGITFAVGDWIVSNGTDWEKVDNTDAVTTVFGRIGNVLANETDYSAFYPSLSGSYANPSWITSLAYSKLTGVPDLSGYVPYSGATTDVDLGIWGIYAGAAEFSGSYVGGNAALVSNTNAQGRGLYVRGGNTIATDAGSRTALEIDSYNTTDIAKFYSDRVVNYVPVEGTSFVKTGGTSAQFLKADGSVDANSYALASTVSGTINYISKFTSSSSIGNSGLYDTGTALGYGTTTPEASFQIAQGDAVLLDRYKNGNPAVAANYFARTFGGTLATPTAILDGELIGAYAANAYNGTNADGALGAIRFYADGDQSGINRKTKIDISIWSNSTNSLSNSVFKADEERILLSDASDGVAAPVAIGYYGKDGITGENPHKFQVVSDGLNPTVSMGNFGGATGGNAGGHWWSARGTADSPSASLIGDGWSNGFRLQGTTVQAPSSASFGAQATENFTDTAHGTKLVFQTNANGHNANLGRTSTFTMDQDGGFNHPYSKVQSYAGGQLGSYRFDYMANAGSRSWIIANDYDAFGDLSILQSTTQTGSTYATKIYITPSGNVQVPTTPTNPTDVVRKQELDALNVLSGTYTPTVTGVTNVTGTPTPQIHHYKRVGNEVTVFGFCLITPTAIANTVATITLPIATTSLTTYDLVGHGSSSAPGNTVARVYGTTAGTTATINFNPDAGGGSAYNFMYSFMYTIN